MDKSTSATIWNEYQACREYNTSINLYENVELNENFYIGNQWVGLNAPDLPKPVLNFLKRVVAYFNATLISDDIAVSFSPHKRDPELTTIAKALSKQVDRVIENAKIKTINRDALRDASVDGDACLYFRFNPELETGQMAEGDIEVELIDNTNVCFGNPYMQDVQKQPYIIMAKRMMLSDLRDEAEKYGVSKSDINLITADGDDTQMERGDNTKMTTKLIKLYKHNGTVRCVETAEKIIIREEYDTGYKLYPIAWLSWEKVKKSYHGQAALTGLIQNQIHVNRLFAMTIRSVEMNAFPKVLYDSSKIKKWSNTVGQAIAVDNGVGNVNDVFATIRGGDVSGQVMDIIQASVSMTRDFLGASDAALGNVKPDNTSAIIAVQQASAIPLELQRLAFYQFVEDYVRIMVDIMRQNYSIRMIDLDTSDDGETQKVELDFSTLSNINLELNVDVGASAYWSELMQLQTMDNLFAKGLVTDAITYLESVPAKYLRNKEKIIESIKRQQEMMANVAPQGEPTTQGGQAASESDIQQAQAMAEQMMMSTKQ